MTDWRIAAKTRDRLGESAMWHQGEKAVYWVDWYGPTVHRLDAGGKVENWTIAGASIVGSLVFATRGRLLLALDTGLQLFDPATGALADFADPNGGRHNVAYNDSKLDRSGNYWVGSFDVLETEPRGILYRIDTTGAAMVGDSGFAVTNGPAFSPDGKVLYFSDSMGRRVIAYDVAADGRLGPRRLFASFAEEDGIPDGLTVDSAGHLWCAQYGVGRVSRFDAQGVCQEMLQLPVPTVTSCSLGGEGLQTLYVTTGWGPGVTRAEDEPGEGGALFMTKVKTPGIAEGVFHID